MSRLALLSAVTLAACDSPLPPETQQEALPVLGTAIVSNPVAATMSASLSPPGLALRGAAVDEVVYVSLPPGTIPDAAGATVRNPRTGSEVAVPVLGGGFDPVAVVAAAGDTLELDVRLVGVGELVRYALVVPPRRPPVIVRTDPPPKKRDVPLNATMLIVFSEPIDPLTLPGSVELSLDGGPVAGALAFGDAASLTVTFTPAERLAADTEYTLVVTQAVTDLDGDTLAAPTTVSFVTEHDTSTESEAPYAAYVRVTPWGFEGDAPRYVLREDSTFILEFTNVLGCCTAESYAGTYSGTASQISFDFADGTVADPWRATGALSGDSLIVQYNDAMHSAQPAAGQARFDDGAYLLVGSPASPLPSLSGRIAFVSPYPGSPTPYVFVANADGSGLTPLARGRLPAWSPDGQTIAFVRWPGDEGGPSGIYVMRADGAYPTRLASGSDPAWSPDGTRIVFVDSTGIAAMNADGSNITTILNFEETWGVDPDGMGGVAEPVWSSDGQRIAFTRLGGEVVLRVNDIYVMNADGSQLGLLTARGGCGRNSPAWSASGSDVALAACGYIALISPDGSSYRWVTWGSNPTWSPDGQWLAFQSGGWNPDWQSGGLTQSGIYVVDATGGVRHLLIAISLDAGGSRIAWTSQE